MEAVLGSTYRDITGDYAAIAANLLFQHPGAEEKQSIDCVVINADNADKYTLFEVTE